MKPGLLFPLCLVLLLATGLPHSGGCAQPAARPGRYPDPAAAGEVVALANALRQEHGLPALNAHPILMRLAQAQADYLAGIGGGTHLNAAGQRPFQRALAAGYPVAGDLSLGGFFSENMQFGPGLTPQQVVEAWMGDDMHRNTLFSEWRSDMGAGVAGDGAMIYYVLDTGLAGSPVAVQTQAAGLALDLSTGQSVPVVAPGATSTPAADGSIVHTVHQGETLWGIAAVYGITVEQVAVYNRLSRFQFIHPGDMLLVRPPATATRQAAPAVSSQVPRGAWSGTPAPTLAPLALVKPAPRVSPPRPVTQLLGWGALFIAVAGGLGVLVEALRKR